jgi:hypothetical protein
MILMLIEFSQKYEPFYKKAIIISAYFQDFKVLLPRLMPVSGREYSIETVLSLVESNFVLVSTQYDNERIMSHYNQFGLIETGEESNLSYWGFPGRKNLNISIKSKLEKL